MVWSRTTRTCRRCWSFRGVCVGTSRVSSPQAADSSRRGCS
ncbi:unnamed protein product [Timema podura]|uniref:Uncharacterized protein n=1 Tax=Timema podura TaxID=61482 RepID=A0ABN7PNC3_TIMPD|nr:unnamed protein product [Timema podura]